MANPTKELTNYLTRKVEALLTATADQPDNLYSREKRDLQWYATIYEPTHYLIQKAGQEGKMLALLNSSDETALVATLKFLQEGCLYPLYTPGMLLGMIRLFSLVGHKDDAVQQAACSTICKFAKNENTHGNILENTYSLIDMINTRKPYPERAAVTAAAYAFSDPIMMKAAVGVTSRCDIIKRSDNVFNKSSDLMARRMGLNMLKSSGRQRASMTNEDINETRERFRILQAALDATPYFAVTASYALARHYIMWGFAGQLSAVVTASVLSGMTSALIGGVYTKGWLDSHIEEMKYFYALAHDKEDRKARLKRLNRAMSPLPGKSPEHVTEDTPERYTSLKEVTEEIWEMKVHNTGCAFAAAAVLGGRWGWFRIVPLVARSYTMLRLGPFFHKVFPALSMKYSRRPRAILPFFLLPTAALKAAEVYQPGILTPPSLRCFSY